MKEFLFSEDVRRNPYPWYDELRRAAPVFPLDGGRVWLVFGYDAVKHVLHDTDTFASAVTPPGARTAQWMIFTDPPRHQRLRGLVAAAFTPRAVAALEPRIREIARELLAARIACVFADGRSPCCD